MSPIRNGVRRVICESKARKMFVRNRDPPLGGFAKAFLALTSVGCFGIASTFLYEVVWDRRDVYRKSFNEEQE